MTMQDDDLKALAAAFEQPEGSELATPLNDESSEAEKTEQPIDLGDALTDGKESEVTEEAATDETASQEATESDGIDPDIDKFIDEASDPAAVVDEVEDAKSLDVQQETIEKSIKELSRQQELLKDVDPMTTPDGVKIPALSYRWNDGAVIELKDMTQDDANKVIAGLRGSGKEVEAQQLASAFVDLSRSRERYEALKVRVSEELEAYDLGLVGLKVEKEGKIWEKSLAAKGYIPTESDKTTFNEWFIQKLKTDPVFKKLETREQMRQAYVGSGLSAKVANAIRLAKEPAAVEAKAQTRSVPRQASKGQAPDLGKFDKMPVTQFTDEAGLELLSHAFVS